MAISENFIDAAFRIGRLHGKVGIPKAEVSHIEGKFGVQAVDAYNHGYDHGYMERKTARTTNEAYAPLNYKGRIHGEFVEKQHKRLFQYAKADPTHDAFGLSNNLPHVVFVGPTGEDKRYAHVKNTVAHVAVDEDEHGKPIIQKWDIKNHKKYTNEDENLDIDSYVMEALAEMSKDTQYYLKHSRNYPVKSHILKKKDLLSTLINKKVERNI